MRSPLVDSIPTIFAGMARSGTTYLGEIANRYLGIAAVNEGTFEFWLADQDCRPERLRNDATLDKLLLRLADHLYFRFLYEEDFDARTVANDLRALVEERSQRGIARAALVLAAQRWQRNRLGHEDPTFMYDLRKVVDMFPGCRVVHIVRDPRDVTASVLQFPWGPNNEVVAANDWNRLVGEACKLGAELGPDRYFEFRYEDLLRKTDEVFPALLRFTTGSADPAIVAEFERHMAKNPLRNNFAKWNKTLSPLQVRRIETEAREQMEQHGYELHYPPTAASPVSAKVWRLHHRAVQLRNVLFGKLHIDGNGIVDPHPPSALKGPSKRVHEAVAR